MFRLIVHAAVREEILSLPADVYQEDAKNALC